MKIFRLETYEKDDYIGARFTAIGFTFRDR